MILQALKEYYDRKAADPAAQIAPPGFEWKEIPYVLVLQADGTPVDLCSTYEGDGKKRRARSCLVPQAVKRSVGIASNLLWDNPEYVFGVVLRGKPARVLDQHSAFRNRMEDLDGVQDEGLEAIRRFLSVPNIEERLIIYGVAWGDLLKSGAYVSFRLSGDKGLVVERPAIQERIRELARSGEPMKGTCMVTGDLTATQRLHPAIKGVYGAQSSGANIVSFNLDAFKSHGKEQGANAPIGQETVFAYTTAINHLLGKDSKQRMQVGDASTVFWAARECDFEKQVPDFFGEPPKDDPDRGTRAVESLFKAVHTGAFVIDDDRNHFYALGLAPNASRIAVRFWVASTVTEMAMQIRRHFVDTRIVHSPKERDTVSLFRLLVSTAALGRSENIVPNLSGDTMRAILQGLPYPKTLLQAAVRRIRAEHDINYPRAALIKACINRDTRSRNPHMEEELKMSLDDGNANIGYRLGRLFAALEKIQQEASPGINATIRDKFYGAASGTPVTVFGNLMRLKNHHLAKLENRGRAVNLERLLGSIMDSITDFPPHLNLADQGRFAIGYYHQMQDFYTKKADKS